MESPNEHFLLNFSFLNYLMKVKWKDVLVRFVDQGNGSKNVYWGIPFTSESLSKKNTMCGVFKVYAVSFISWILYKLCFHLKKQLAIWCMVTEYKVWRMILISCIWRLILKCCVWWKILKCCAWRLIFEILRLARDFKTLCLTPARCPSDTSQTQLFEIRCQTQHFEISEQSYNQGQPAPFTWYGFCLHFGTHP